MASRSDPPRPADPVVSFDLDGVLMRNPFERGVEPFVREHIHRSSSLRELDVQEAHGRIRREGWAIFHRWMSEGDWVAAFDWDLNYAEITERFGGDPVPDVAELVERFSAHEGVIDLLPGAREALELLRGAGVPLVAVTNGYAKYQRPPLRELGILDAFERIVSPDAVGFAKPQPEIFRAVPGLFAHIGDTLPHDVLGANRAGLRTVWVHPKAPAAVLGDAPDEAALREEVAAGLERMPLRTRHAGATVDEALPDAVARDALEAARIVLGWLRG